MSFFKIAKQLINITDFFTRKYDATKKWIQDKFKAHRARSIRNAVDNRDTKRIGKRLRKLLKRRQERYDSN